MPNKKKEMLTIRQLIRLKRQGCSHKAITKQLSISRTTVIDYVRQLEASGPNWQQLDEIDDSALAVILGAGNENNDRYRHLLNFFPYMEKELKRQGVTRQHRN